MPQIYKPRPKVERACLICGQPFMGNAKRLYDTDACRKKAQRLPAGELERLLEHRIGLLEGLLWKANDRITQLEARLERQK